MCKCSAERQTATHVILVCPIYKAPNGVYGLKIFDENSRGLPFTTCPEISFEHHRSHSKQQQPRDSALKKSSLCYVYACFVLKPPHKLWIPTFYEKVYKILEKCLESEIEHSQCCVVNNVALQLVTENRFTELWYDNSQGNGVSRGSRDGVNTMKEIFH